MCRLRPAMPVLGILDVQVRFRLVSGGEGHAPPRAHFAIQRQGRAPDELRRRAPLRSPHPQFLTDPAFVSPEKMDAQNYIPSTKLIC